MNRFFYFFLLFFIFTADAYSENFSEIKVLGNKRITNETIILFSGAENLRNKEINDNDLNNLLKKLYETNFLKM